MSFFLFVSIVQALEPFQSFPKLIGASHTEVKVLYALGPEILRVYAGVDDLYPVSTDYDYIDEGYYYSSASFNRTETFTWKIYDFVGREIFCQTSLNSSANSSLNSAATASDQCTQNGCYPSSINDGWCDTACLTESCGWDGTDCATIDAISIVGCNITMIGDGYCNPECNNQIAFFDGGDCITECTKPTCSQFMLSNCVCELGCFYEECHYDGGDCINCAPGCTLSMLNDGVCQSACNNTVCGFDLNDCKHEALCIPECLTAMIGDGICDSACDVYICDYDGGDCISEDQICNEECADTYLGDGICEPSCDVSSCSFDKSDCNQVSVSVSGDSLIVDGVTLVAETTCLKSLAEWIILSWAVLVLV